MYYFPDLTNVGCVFRFLSPSLRGSYLYQHLDERDKTRRRLEATRGKHGFVIFFDSELLWKLCWNKFPYISLLSLSRIRIIVLTCPDNINVMLQVCKKSSAEIMRACKITQITIRLRGQYYFKWNLRSLSVCSCSCEDSRVLPLNLYWDMSITEELHSLKAVDRHFVRNGGNNTDSIVALQLGGCIRTNR